MYFVKLRRYIITIIIITTKNWELGAVFIFITKKTN